MGYYRSEKDCFGEFYTPGRPKPYVEVYSVDELWHIRQEKLTYNIIEIRQGNSGLIFVVELLCIAYVIEDIQ